MDLPGCGSRADGLIGIERGPVDSFRPKVICSRAADGGLAELGFGITREVDESAVVLIKNMPEVFLTFLNGWIFVLKG